MGGVIRVATEEGLLAKLDMCYLTIVFSWDDKDSLNFVDMIDFSIGDVWDMRICHYPHQFVLDQIPKGNHPLFVPTDEKASIVRNFNGGDLICSNLGIM